MLEAEQTLDAIFRHERPDQDRLRSMFRELFMAVDFLHCNSVVHGDIKLLNVVRVNGRLKLIDLDASVELDSPHPFSGLKFSSGTDYFGHRSSSLLNTNDRRVASRAVVRVGG